jgi:hypothetical protein
LEFVTQPQQPALTLSLLHVIVRHLLVFLRIWRWRLAQLDLAMAIAHDNLRGVAGAVKAGGGIHAQRLGRVGHARPRTPHPGEMLLLMLLMLVLLMLLLLTAALEEIPPDASQRRARAGARRWSACAAAAASNGIAVTVRHLPGKN